MWSEFSALGLYQAEQRKREYIYKKKRQYIWTKCGRARKRELQKKSVNDETKKKKKQKTKKPDSD